MFRVILHRNTSFTKVRETNIRFQIIITYTKDTSIFILTQFLQFSQSPYLTLPCPLFIIIKRNVFHETNNISKI